MSNECKTFFPISRLYIPTVIWVGTDMQFQKLKDYKILDTVKLQAVDQSIIQFWNFLAKGHSTSTYYIGIK